MKKYTLCFLCLLLTSCISNRSYVPKEFDETLIQGKHIPFYILEKIARKNRPIRIYIEGSGNPNPSKQMALALAQKDPSENIIYLTQACQYIQHKFCKEEVWKSYRFDQQIILEMVEVLTQIQQRYTPGYIELVGYDDGAALALLLANRIPNVRRVITIGGIFDTQHIPHLKNEPLNPMLETAKLELIPQLHFIGEKDDKAPLIQAKTFSRKFKNPISFVIKTVSKTHHYDWDKVEFKKYY